MAQVFRLSSSLCDTLMESLVPGFSTSQTSLLCLFEEQTSEWIISLILSLFCLLFCLLHEQMNLKENGPNFLQEAKASIVLEVTNQTNEIHLKVWFIG